MPSEDKGHVPEEIIRRLKKLERMASSTSGASEGEMTNALEAIRILRDKFDIEDHMLRDEPDSSRVVEETAMTWNRLVNWQEQLAFSIAELFDCRWFVRNEPRGRTKAGSPKMYKGIRFYGMPRDVRVSCETYEITYYTIRMMMRMAYGGGNWNIKHRSYADGICLRLRDRVRKMKGVADAAPQTGAIVLAKGLAVKEYGLSLNLKFVQRGKLKRDHEAAALGYIHGDKLDLSPSDRKVRDVQRHKLT